MQIHYIWVNDFGKLQHAGINLSARLIFKMEPKSDTESHYELTIFENPNYIKNFFDNEDITNVTAIIGKNGAGKTTILNYIKSRLPEGLEANVRHDLFIYSLGDDGSEQFFIVKPELVQISIVNKTAISFSEQIYGEEISENFRFASRIGEAEFIYYSYLLDFNEDMQPWKGLTNISTSFLMMEERRRITEENRDERTQMMLLSKCNDLDNLHISEVARAIQFLLSDATSLPFDKPEFLTIEIDLVDTLFFTSQASKYSEINKMLEMFQSEGNVIGDRNDNLVKNFLLSILVNFLINDYKYSANNPYFHELKPMKEQNVKDYILDYFTSMANIEFEYSGHNVEFPRHKALSNLVPQFVTLLEKLIIDKIIIVKDAKTMELVLGNTTEAVFKDFTKLYLKIKGINTFLNFRWRTLSGGEQSYLSLMSRFYHVRYHRIGDLPQNLIILIDEGDIGYHPEWQRQFFDITIGFLSELFSGYKLQLIITANTPFLSSDLPKSHVLFVEWIDKKLSVFHSKDNNRESTFAANIHTLFSNSFYMDGILMGEFAKRRINKVIEYLKKPMTQGETPDENYKKTIDIIGEPALRKKLQDMWFEKFGLDEELRMLEERIEEITRLKSGR